MLLFTASVRLIVSRLVRLVFKMVSYFCRLGDLLCFVFMSAYCTPWAIKNETPLFCDNFGKC